MSKKDKIEKLDNVFSKYIRLSNSNFQGMCTCISCGKQIPWKQCDAGHYVSRRHMSLRFDVKNVHPQCVECNRFKDGNIEAYKRSLGKTTVFYLENKKSDIKQWDDIELDFLIRSYSKKIKELL